MGNTDSMPISDAVTSSLSPETQKRLKKAAPYSAAFFELGTLPVNPPRTVRPSMNSFFEAAAMTPSPAPTSIRPSSSRKASSANSSTFSRSTTTSSNSKASNTLSTDDLSLTPNTPHRSASQSTPMSAINEDNDAINNSNNDLRSLDASQRIESSQIEGRRYINQPKTTYVLPFDDDESDRLIVMHFLLKHAFEGNFMAPVTSVLQMGYLEKQRPSVLDIGCGPGTWVLEMATEYPNADFHGIDLCPMFPTAIKPNNAHFQQHDIFSGPLPFKDNSFDYVYMRAMLICMTRDNLTHTLTEMSRILKPGGYFEILDVEYRIQRPGPISETLINQIFHNNMQTHNIDVHLSHQLSTFAMTKPSGSGFVDIQQQRVAIPLGWGGQLGELHAQNIGCLLRSLSPSARRSSRVAVSPLSSPPSTPTSLSPFQEINPESIKEVLDECQKYQSHLNWYVCFGHKSVLSGTSLSPSVSNSSNQNNSTTSSMMNSSMHHHHSGNFGYSLATPPESHESLEDGAWEVINDFVHGFTD